MGVSKVIPSIEKLEDIVKQLQAIMRIQDWDINIEIISDVEMTRETGISCSAYCTRVRHNHEAKILINEDCNRILNQSNYWYHALVHELYHVVTDDFIFAVDDARQYIKNKHVKREIKLTTDVKYEELVNNLAKGFVNAYPVTNFIKEGDI